MQGLTNFLLLIQAMTGLVGRGPVLFGLAVALALPVGVLLVLIEALYPGGVIGWVARVLVGALSRLI